MEARLAELTDLRDRGIISAEEYTAARKAALGIPHGDNASHETPKVSLAVVGTPIQKDNHEDRGTTMHARRSSSTSNAAAPLPVFRCRNGHHLSFTGQTPKNTVCWCCGRLIPGGDHHFVCNACEQAGERAEEPRRICHECGANQTLSVRESNAKGTGQWHVGLFDCLKDKGICFDSFCCFYCQLTVVDRFSEYGIMTSASSGSRCSRMAFTFCFACSLDILTPLIYTASGHIVTGYHQDAQIKLGIDAEHRMGCCTSYVAGQWCRCCLLARVAQEYKVRGIVVGGVVASRPPAGYQPPAPIASMGDDAALEFKRKRGVTPSRIATLQRLRETQAQSTNTTSMLVGPQAHDPRAEGLEAPFLGQEMSGSLY